MIFKKSDFLKKLFFQEIENLNIIGDKDENKNRQNN